MKPTFFYAALLGLSVSTLSLSAQVSYGPGAGTGSSTTNCFFGSNAGNATVSGSIYNVVMGHSALRNTTTGDHNIAIGGLSLFSNTTSSYNVAIGGLSLYDNTSGSANTAVGYYSMNRNTSGNDNTALGSLSLYYNTTGDDNVAIGRTALYVSTTGNENTAVGSSALRQNTTGYQNAALGYRALNDNTSGYGNTASGVSAAQSTTTGDYNAVVGHSALNGNETGSFNVSMGYRSLYNPKNGFYNIGVGSRALNVLNSGSYNTASGGFAAPSLTSGNFNVVTGYYSGANVSDGDDNVMIGHYSGGSLFGSYYNSIAIGYNTRFSASNQARLGNYSMTSIGGQVGWTSLSDARFKSEVQEDVLGLEFIEALRPVSYKVDRQAVAEFDGAKIEDDAAPVPASYHTGFLAQEVESTAKALGFERFDGVDTPVNEQGRYGLRYSSFVVPLVKSVQELSEQNKELRQQIAQQQAQIDALLKHAQQQTTNSLDLPSTDGAVLYQNAPNPFSKETTIRLSLPATAAKASLIVTNLEGRQLLQQPITERGETNLNISANQLPAGLYLYTLVVDDQLIDSKKMLITE